VCAKFGAAYYNPYNPEGSNMAENKTKATDSSVDSYIDAIDDEIRRRDCRALAKLMAKVTKQKPKMWGPSIVGFGSYHYKYDSGREGDACLIGLSSRKGDISIYLTADFPGHDERLSRLGKHKMGKACLYIRKLDDVDPKVLEKLVVGSFADSQRRHG